MQDDTREDIIDVRLLIAALLDRKWFIISVTAACAVLSIIFALLATEWYKSTVLLAPATEQSSPMLSGQLGGLASIAGVSFGNDESSIEALATIKSRDFLREFIDDRNLLPVLFADEWDADGNAWADSDPNEWPDWREGVEYFQQEVFNASEDPSTRLVTVSVEWTDAAVAAEWANDLVFRLNARMRAGALAEAERNVAYLQEELATTNVVVLQQSIGRLLEVELQKLMLARGKEEFSFRVIDSADVPRDNSRPNRPLIVIMSTMAGALIAALFVLFRSAASRPGQRAKH